MPEFLYLASQSPRRRQLLEQLGVHHELLLPHPSEDAEGLEAVMAQESPVTYVQRVTGLKLDAALHRREQRGLSQAPILCSDTTVALGGVILGKPADADEAAAMLGKLSGNTHRVLTAVAVQLGQRRVTALCESRVRFSVLSLDQINRYVATGEPMGKAGAYGIQGKAAAYIEHISGSYSGIMGLPMFETAKVLRAIGFTI